MLLLEYKKICNGCKLLKNQNEYHKYSLYKDGYHYYCKECKSKANERYRNGKHREENLGKKKEYRNNNLEKEKNRQRTNYINNKDNINNRNKQYWANTKTQRSKTRKRYVSNRLNVDSNFRLVRRLRWTLRESLKKRQIIKSQHTLDLLGCDLDFLKQHLQQTAIDNSYFGFDINNYDGNEFHIDHIIPISVWNLKCSYHQKLCFHWSNLQILNSQENMLKLNKILLEA
jgi:hypothetical protein